MIKFWRFIYNILKWLVEKVYPHLIQDNSTVKEVNGNLIFPGEMNYPVRCYQIQFKQPISPSKLFNDILPEYTGDVVFTSQKELFFPENNHES